MKGHGPRYERDASIIMNEPSEEATIWTASQVIYRRLLKRLGPSSLVKNEETSAEFMFPNNFLVTSTGEKPATHDPRQMARRTAEKSEPLTQSLVGKEKSPNPRPA